MFKFIATLAAVLIMTSCASEPPKPVKALLLTGGCCHDYDAQQKLIQKFTKDKINVEWTVLHEGGKGGDHRFSVYSEKGWAEKFDVVVHNECFAKTKDDAFISKVVKDHTDSDIGVIMIHCAMHTFRDAKQGTEDWCKLIGLQSKRHEHQGEYALENIAPKHPIMQGFPQVWQAPKDELYIVIREFPNMTPLARAYGPSSKKWSPILWTNEVGDNRIFGISHGHNTTTMEDPVFQKVFTNALLWTTRKLNDDGTPKVGYNAKK